MLLTYIVATASCDYVARTLGTKDGHARARGRSWAGAHLQALVLSHIKITLIHIHKF